MKTSLSWLRQYVDIDMAPAAIADSFTHLGLEVESLTGIYQKREGIVIGKVLESKRHPNADRLTVNKIDIGTEVLDVVCGAPNIRAGLSIALILSGYKLPDGTEIKKSKIRGEMSNGMCCSERELGLSEEASGIIELKEGLPLGETLDASHLGSDPVFDVAVLPNRPDCLSVVGLARELSGKFRIPLRIQEPRVTEGPVSCASKVKVTIIDADACPRYSARHISGVKIVPSPDWLVKRLRAAGVRPINNVVDVTNFVLMELGHPLHAFDYLKVAGRSIIVRRAQQGEIMKTLDGVARPLQASDLLICDAEKPVALAGIMGGESSEVSDTTVEILLESAYFEPVGIRKSSKKLGLTSEASYRFERGADPNVVLRALDRATALICELSGGTASAGLIDVNPGNIQPWKLSIRSARVNRILGTTFSTKEIKEPLENIGLSCSSGDDFTVVIPTNRPDLLQEADIIEEVARIIGYDKVPVKTYASIDLTVRTNPVEQFREEIRRLMAGLGLQEVVTNSLVNPADLKLIGLDAGAPRLLNPLSPDMSVLRTSMLISLMAVISGNRSRSNRDLSLFELGRVFAAGEKDKQPKETEILAGVFTGLRGPVQWNGKNQESDLHAIRGLLETLVARVSNHAAVFSKEAAPGGEGLRCEAGGEVLGRAIVVSGMLLKRYDLQDPVCYFELDLDRLYSIRKEQVKYKPVSKFPPADRDLAVVTDEPVSAVEMMQTIRSESDLLEEVVLFDVFRGKDLGAGKKSTAFSLRFRKADTTLTDKEVENAFQKILNRLKSQYNAVLR